MKKKILIISGSFYPTNTPRAFRTAELAKELSRQGHEVTLLIPNKDDKIHSEYEKEHNLKIEDLGKLKWEAPNFGKSKIGHFATRVAVRLLSLLFEFPGIELYFKVSKALKKQNGYDILISIAVPYPVHWGVAKVWKRDKSKNTAPIWIADCGDPYMGQENDTFRPPFYFKYVEKWFMRKADYITVPVKSAIPAYYPEFHSKIRVISQGFRFEDIKPAEKDQANKYPCFAYSGSLIPGRRDPQEFLQMLVDYPHPYRFDVYTSQKELIKPFAEKSKGRIVLKDYAPREKLLYELSKLDFVVNLENAGAKQIPSKIIDYVIIDKPILSVNSFQFDKQAAEEFLKGNYQNRLFIENPEQYRIENVCKKFLELSNELV